MSLAEALLARLAQRKAGFEGERKMRIYYQRGRWSVLQAKVYSTKREGPMDAKDLD